MKNAFLAAATMAVVMVTASVVPSQAMGVASFTRSVVAPKVAQTAVVGERDRLSYRMFCLQYGTDCDLKPAIVIAHTNKLRAKLASVNRAVNRAMPAIRAEREFLSLNPLPGASDDYAMMKRDRLIRAGIPAAALRIESIAGARGVHHSVLVVATSHGEFLLDHQQRRVTRRLDAADSVASIQPARAED